MSNSRPDPTSAAHAFVERFFPEARAAFLGGSVVRGEATATSDLDVVILTDRPEAPFRASFVFQGWPVEAFVHTDGSYRQFFESDRRRRRPTLPTVCSEGILLRDVDGSGQRIRQEALALLAAGPEPLTPEQVADFRYHLTDLLDDFEGVEREDESFFLANDLAAEAVALLLAHHRRWGGADKWVPRALRRLDPTLAERLHAALAAFYRQGDKQPLIGFAHDVLALVGGRLFEGYWANPAGVRRVPPTDGEPG